MSQCPWTTLRSTMLLTAIFVLVTFPLSIQLPLTLHYRSLDPHFGHGKVLGKRVQSAILFYDLHFFPPPSTRPC